MAKQTDGKRGKSAASSPMALAGIGLEFAVAVGLLAGGGYLLDGWLGTKPWFTLVGTFLGFGLGLYRMFKELQRSNRST